MEFLDRERGELPEHVHNLLITFCQTVVDAADKLGVILRDPLVAFFQEFHNGTDHV